MLSDSPRSSIASSSRPTFQSAFSENPANTSIWRAKSRFCASDILSHAGNRSGRSVSSASGGMIPSRFCRSNVFCRYTSQPSSNSPRYLSAHSLNTWCGAWVAPVA
ncbi:Uncharacterised protein [Mycobacterium tuberculosis]|uniref:Uncharacterized protein n=1 Tax=Mycobacterium tuberculosis TaxID=1773 RepID=A0A916LCR9_MYCTX|nr:Uncharacterised protein [Mycobacterium tuberculosis]COY75782.1 Uncharacterised protein [Mycobacterium tuberculosis]